MNLLLLTLLCSVLAIAAEAENLYLRSDATGANDGSDWQNAWTDFEQVQWGGELGKLGAGDTLWVAGGTYKQGIVPKASGGDNAARSIHIMRVLKSDTVPTQAAGWNNRFDSQVIIQNGLSPRINNVGDYLCIDGRIESGISFQHAVNDGGSVIDFGNGAIINYLTLTNVEVVGPGNNSPFYDYRGDPRCINFTSWQSDHYAYNTGHRITHCRIHGSLNLIYIANTHDAVIEHCELYYNGVTAGNSGHPNVLISLASNKITFRYNRVHDWATEGILLERGRQQDWYVYGNLWSDGLDGTYSRIIEGQNDTSGPILFYNNTVVNTWATFTHDGNGWSQGCASVNNIFFKCGGVVAGDASWKHDSNLTDAQNGEIHGIRNANIGIFANFSSKDYRIVGVVGANYPRDKGTDLGVQYSVDIDGKLRGQDGAWDIGAFEYVKGVENTNCALQVWPVSLAFETVGGSATKSATVTVRNAGGGTLCGTARVSAPFYIDGPASYSLAAGQATTIRIGYVPSSALRDNGSVIFTGGAGAELPVSAGLVGANGL
jgi:hypothetical protein